MRKLNEKGLEITDIIRKEDIQDVFYEGRNVQVEVSTKDYYLKIKGFVSISSDEIVILSGQTDFSFYSYYVKDFKIVDKHSIHITLNSGFKFRLITER